MPHFIIRKGDQYQYPRRNTGRMYTDRTTYGPDIGQARVFNTQSAANNSNRGWGEVIEIELRIKNNDQEKQKEA